MLMTTVPSARRLYRDSTLYKDGKHVRDLSKLNRDLGKVLLVACEPDAYHLQPENAIKVRPLTPCPVSIEGTVSAMPCGAFLCVCTVARLDYRCRQRILDLRARQRRSALASQLFCIW